MDWSTPPFTLRQLQYAVAVSELLSFRRAAERCHVSQPALSAQLRELEQALGVALFERARRKVLPTTAGVALVDRARRLLADAADLTAAASVAADPLSNTLRIGVIPTIAPYLLPAISVALRKAHPRLTVRWVEEKTPALVRDLDAGELHAAILALESEVGDLESQVIAVDSFVLATSRTHPLGRAKGPTTVAELRGAEVLLLDEGHCFREQALQFCAKAKTRELEFRATSMATLTQMTAAGTCVTLLPHLAVRTEAARFDLRTRPFAKPGPSRTIALAWRKRSSLAPALKVLATTMTRAYPR